MDEEYYYSLNRNKQGKIMNILIVNGKDTIKKELLIAPNRHWVGSFESLSSLFDFIGEMK